MKKRVLSALLVLCLACGLVSTAWATGGAGAASEPTATVEPSSVVSVDPATPESGAEETEPEVQPAEEEDTAESQPDQTVEGTAAPVAAGTEYTAALESDGQTLNVIVTAPDGAFAEDVDPQLSVTMMNAEDELDAVAGELDKAQVKYDGFAAMDITFTDKDTGEEIEPAQQVSVRIELPQAIVDSGIDLTTLAVQHLEEDADGNVQNVTEVATLDNGITLSEEAAAAANEAAGVAPMSDMPAEEATAGDAAETPAAVAEFDVDGFSYFTITWTNYQNQTDVSRELTVTLIDEEGNELPGEHLAKYDISTSRNVTLNGQSSNIPYVQNYEFVRAVIALDADNANSGTTVYQIRLNADQETESVWHSLDGWQFGATWRPGYGWGYWETVVVSTSYSWQYRISDSGVWTDFDENTQHIYLIYSKDIDGSAGGSGGDVEVQLPTPSISKTAIRNGDGETYSLNLSVTGGIGSQTETSYVDVLMIVDESNSMYNYSLLEPTRTAMRELVKELERNENVTARYGIVTFGSSGKQEMSWTSITEENFDPDAEDDSYNGINRTAVGRKITAITSRGGNDGGTNYMAGLDTAKNLIDISNNDPEYDRLTIVVFLSDGEPTYYVNQNGSNVAGHMGGSTGFGTDSYEWRRTLEVADDIVCDQFYSVGIGNAKSDYLGTNNDFGGLAEVVNAGNPVAERFFNAGQGAENLTQKFKDIAGNATDLYIKNITIHDTLNLTNVQQVPGSEITVAVTNPSGVEVSLSEVGLNEDMITANYSDAQGLTFSIPNYELEPGYTYTVTMQIEPTAWAKTTYANQVYPDTATENWDTGTHSFSTGDKGIYSNTEATLTYEYTENEEGTEAEPLEYPMPVIQVPEPQEHTLTIKKNVTGDMGDTTKAFTFTVSGIEDGIYDGEQEILNENGNVTSYTNIRVTVTDNTFSLKDGQSVTFTLQEGKAYSVTETDLSAEGYNQSSEVSENGVGTASGRTYTVNNLTADTTVTFTNHKELVGPPTGLERNDTPYTILVTVAGIAGLALIGGMVARRVRRRREE